MTKKPDKSTKDTGLSKQSEELLSMTKRDVAAMPVKDVQRLVHEMQEAGTALDPAKYDHPVTMFYVDGDRLNLVHYCDAGNRPHMLARKSSDGNTVEFDFADLSGGTKYGHMHHGVFTIIDSNHHTEDWIFMMPGDKPMHAHFDLHRAKDGSAVSGK